MNINSQRLQFLFQPIYDGANVTAFRRGPGHDNLATKRFHCFVKLNLMTTQRGSSRKLHACGTTAYDQNLLRLTDPVLRLKRQYLFLSCRRVYNTPQPAAGH